MIKLGGAAFVILVCLAAGLAPVRKMRERIVSLNAIITSVIILKGELCSRLTPMYDAFIMLAERADYPAARLYSNAARNMAKLGDESFCGIWEDSVLQTRELALSGDETRIIMELGGFLGRYDVNEQSKALDRACAELERCLREAREGCARDGKIYAAFSVAAGIFAVILLW